MHSTDRFPPRTRRAPRWAPLLCALLAVLAPRRGAAAKLCGGNVNGQSVPCACGDVVVSDVVLGNDPVTATVCPENGLVVRAPGVTHGVTIDLAGKTLRGSGHGTGVWLVYGGPGGARVVSTGAPAHIAGFMDGIVAHGGNTVALIDNVAVSDTMHDGVRVDTKNYSVHATTVSGAGRDGFSLMGERLRVTGAQAHDTQRYGFLVMGQGAVIGVPGAGDVATGAGMAGFRLMGTGHQLVDCTATGGHKFGVWLSGMHLNVSGCTVSGNRSDGITGVGMGWRLAHNRALQNGHDGLNVHGTQMTDAGGNAGNGNGGPGQPAPTKQCAIGEVPCTP